MYKRLIYLFKSDITISENQMSLIFCLIEEAIVLDVQNWQKNVAKRIYKDIGDSNVYVSVKYKKRIFGKDKAYVKI